MGNNYNKKGDMLFKGTDKLWLECKWDMNHHTKYSVGHIAT